MLRMAADVAQLHEKSSPSTMVYNAATSSWSSSPGCVCYNARQRKDAGSSIARSDRSLPKKQGSHPRRYDANAHSVHIATQPHTRTH
jgi:hypothetical protein